MPRLASGVPHWLEEGTCHLPAIIHMHLGDVESRVARATSGTAL